MRNDQYLRLQQLEEKLTDQLLIEAEPANWSGHGLLPRDMSQQQRGDRYWCKKNAVATMSMTLRIATMIGQVQHNAIYSAQTITDEDTAKGLLDAEIAEAEKEAARLLAKYQKGKAAA